MNMDNNDFLLTDAEIASARRELELESSELGLNLNAEPTSVTVLDALQPAERSRFAWTLETLSAPAKRLLFNYSVGDESLTRSVVAWDRSDDGEVVTLVSNGAMLRIGTRTAEELKLLSANVLAVEAGVKETPLSLGMSSAGLLTWLALVEQLQALELSAMLHHYASIRIFNRADLETRLAGATEGDFRWPLMFFTKVLPGDLPAAFTAADVDRGLGELEALALVEEVTSGVWGMTPLGDWLASEMIDSVSRVGCGVAASRLDGTIGYRTLMFVRTARHVILHLNEGDESVIATVSAGGLDRFLSDVFARPGPDRLPRPPTPSFCTRCGNGVAPGDRFCGECGATISRGVS